jgi:hypothetical protein
MNEAPEKLFWEYLGQREALASWGFTNTVFHTESGLFQLLNRAFPLLIMPRLLCDTGIDQHKHSGSITNSRGGQVLTVPIRWAVAAAFPENATHVVEIAPGSLSASTSRNFEGRGTRVIVIGSKGKGDIKLHDAQGVKYEERWSKRWAPGLVRTRWILCGSSIDFRTLKKWRHPYRYAFLSP